MKVAIRSIVTGEFCTREQLLNEVLAMSTNARECPVKHDMSGKYVGEPNTSESIMKEMERLLDCLIWFRRIEEALAPFIKVAMGYSAPTYSFCRPVNADALTLYIPDGNGSATAPITKRLDQLRQLHGALIATEYEVKE